LLEYLAVGEVELVGNEITSVGQDIVLVNGELEELLGVVESPNYIIIVILENGNIKDANATMSTAVV
jgi:hypothetical protein